MMVAIQTARPQSPPSDIPQPSPAERRAEYEREMSSLEVLWELNPDLPSIEVIARSIEEKVYIDEMPGEPMTRDMLGDFEPHEDDKLSKDRRLVEYDDSLYSHIWHRTNDPPASSHTSQLFYAPMGVGKSASANLTAKRKFELGWSVASNIGFFYGHRLSGAELMSFAGKVPRHTVLVPDELQDLINTIGASNTVALRLFGTAGGAMLRRRSNEIYGCSAMPWLLPGAYMHGLNYAIKCRPWKPKSGRYIAPPWCYIRQIRIGPYPVKPDNGLDARYGIEEPDEKAFVAYRVLHPYKVWKANHLYDTYADVEVGESVRNTADVMRGLVGGRDMQGKGADALSAIFKLVQSDYDTGEAKIGHKEFIHDLRLWADMPLDVTDGEAKAELEGLITLNYAGQFEYGRLVDKVYLMLDKWGDKSEEDAPDEPLQQYAGGTPFRVAPADDIVGGDWEIVQ